MILVNGRARAARTGAFLGAEILGRDVPEGQLPYLFCGNGSCRDCNVLVEGLPDLPACRIPACPGLSIRAGEEDGADNALSLAIASPPGDPFSTDVVIVGAGPAGLAAADAVREEGKHALVLEARDVQREGVLGRSPVLARGSPQPTFRWGWGPNDQSRRSLFVFREGVLHPISAGAVVVATGASERLPTFPGSTLPGVLPIDLAERYLALDFLPGSRFLVAAPVERAPTLREELLRRGALEARHVPEEMILASVSGAFHVERARLVAASRDRRDEEVSVLVDTVVVAGKRLPAVGLARALGCEVAYDRNLGGDVVTAAPAGVFLAGDALLPGSRGDARESGRRAGKSACTSRRTVL